MLFLMNPNTALLILALLMISSCTRRPVQKDVILNNDPADRTGQHRKMVSSPGAADATYELQFIDTMVAQHETAIDAAQLAATRAQHTEIKQFAREFIEEQRKDITAMRQMRSAWFGNAPPAVNADLPGMQEMIAVVDLNQLDRLKESAFDLEFIRQMTVQDQSAIKLTEDALRNNVRPELKLLAENIAGSRSKDIDKLQNWERQWGVNE